MIYRNTNTDAHLIKAAKNSVQRQSLLNSQDKFVNSNEVSEYKEIATLNESFSCSTKLAYPVRDASLIKTPATALLNKLLDLLLKRQCQPVQIECCLYSSKKQVHLLSLGLEQDKSTSYQKDRLLELILIRLDQLKLVFSVEHIEMSCYQAFSLKRQAQQTTQ